MLDATLQGLVSRALATHRPPMRSKPKTAPDAKPARASAPRKPPRHSAPPPSFAERDSFMSPNAVHAHHATTSSDDARSLAKSTVRSTQDLEMRQIAQQVERLGASKLDGLFKKDQRARERSKLGLKPPKGQKMPYLQLKALRKKQRGQDASSAALACEAGTQSRRQDDALYKGSRHKAHKRNEPRLGDTLRNGALVLSQKTIREVRGEAARGRGGARRTGRGAGRGVHKPARRR